MPSSQPTLLDYDVASDRDPLYTSVDEHSQNKVALTFTVRNSGDDPVTLSKVQVLLLDTSQGPDVVNLILPGSEDGVSVSSPVPGPGGSSWGVSSRGGVLTLTAEPAGSAATFQSGDSLSFEARGVTIREGGTGTAAVEIFEVTTKGQGFGQVRLAVTEAELTVRLWAVTPSGGGMIEPSQTATLQWETTAATVGTLSIPSASPNSITLPSRQYSLALERGQFPVSPIVDTTYTLTCQGRGPDVTKQVTVAVDSLQMGDLEVAPDLTVAKGATAWLSWQTNADRCTLSSQAGGGEGLRTDPADVPTGLPNKQYPSGYPVVVQETSTYTLVAERKKGEKWQSDRRLATLTLGPLVVRAFSAAPPTPLGRDGLVVVNPNDPVTLTWKIDYSTPDSVSISGRTPDGKTALVASGLPVECRPDKPFIVRPAQTTVYTLKCEGFGGPKSATAKVYVCQPAPDMPKLGRGLNVFRDKAEDLSVGAGRQLFSFSLPPATQPVDPAGREGGYWINPDTDEAHLAPRRVLFARNPAVRQTGSKLDTPSQAGDYYASLAGVPPGGGAFNRSAYGVRAPDTVGSYWSAIAELTTTYWSATLDATFDASLDGQGLTLEKGFKDELAALPAAFDPAKPEVVEKFRGLFADYGTHYVSGLTYGIRLSWYMRLLRSSGGADYLEQDIVQSMQESLTRVAGGDVFGGSVGGQDTFSAAGGDQRLMQELVAAPFGALVDGEKEGKQYYQDWAKSGPSNAVVVGYALRGIWLLAAPGDPRRQAVADAYDYFALQCSPVPLYWFINKHTVNLYTTLEQFEQLNGWNLKGVACYVLPQNTRFISKAQKLNRFKGTAQAAGVYYYSTDLNIKEHPYAQEPDHYSYVPLQTVPGVVPLYIFGKVNGAGFQLSTSTAPTSDAYKPQAVLVCYVFPKPLQPF